VEGIDGWGTDGRGGTAGEVAGELGWKGCVGTTGACGGDVDATMFDDEVIGALGIPSSPFSSAASIWVLRKGGLLTVFVNEQQQKIK
jgi:hypothetical protein